MLKSLSIYGVLGILLIPAKCDKISVCIENDKDLRMDCLLEPEPNKSNVFQFLWSSGDKEHAITTNYSSLSPETNLKSKSTVEERKAHNYRMTLPNFSDKLPHNSTLLCKLSGKVARVMVEKDKLPKCSAVSVFLRSPISWIVCLLLFFYQMQS